MTDIVERLRVYATDDHERGCQGRCYDCSCGYDNKRDPLLDEAADTITRLRAEVSELNSMFDARWAAGGRRPGLPIRLLQPMEWLNLLADNEAL